MATYTQGTGQGGTLRLIVDYSQNVSGNQTTFSGRYELTNSWGSTYAYGISWNSSSAGSGDSGSFSVSGNSTITLDSFSVVKGHSSDGSLSNQTFSISIGSTGTSGLGGPTTFSKSISVPNIPRASTPSVDSAEGIDVGEANYMRIYTNTLSSSFRFDFAYKFGDTYASIISNRTNYHDWDIPKSILNEIPNSTSGSGTITSTTKLNGNSIGKKYCSFTIAAGSNVLPSFSGTSHSESVSSVSSKVGAYVQGLSKLNLSISGASGIYSSTITRYKYSVGNVTTNVTSSSGTMTNPISSSGTVPVKYDIQDSRGRWYTETENITVLPYFTPNISDISVQRALSNGVVDNVSGRYIRVNFEAAVASLKKSGVEKNSFSYEIQTRESAGSWVSKGNWTVSSTSFDSYRLIGANDFDLSKSYEVRLIVTDEFNTVNASRTVGTAQVPLDVSETGIGVGKLHEQGTIDTSGDIYHRGGGLVEPIGSILMYAGSNTTSPPEGWYFCRGGTLDRNQYSELFAVIGTTYGSGNGSTTFTVPNLSSRVPVGFHTSVYDTFNPLGKTGGAQTHELTVDEMPSHSHDVRAYYNSSNSDFRVQRADDYGGSGAVISGAALPEGGGNAHNNLQPYLVLSFIIKIV